MSSSQFNSCEKNIRNKKSTPRDTCIPPNLPVFSNFLGHFLKLDDLLGPWEYHRCHEVEEMIANDGIESSVGGM